MDQEKTFLTELANLLAKYNVSIEAIEGGYQDIYVSHIDFVGDGINFELEGPVIDADTLRCIKGEQMGWSENILGLGEALKATGLQNLWWGYQIDFDGEIQMIIGEVTAEAKDMINFKKAIKDLYPHISFSFCPGFRGDAPTFYFVIEEPYLGHEVRWQDCCYQIMPQNSKFVDWLNRYYSNPVEVEDSLKRYAGECVYKRLV